MRLAGHGYHIWNVEVGHEFICAKFLRAGVVYRLSRMAIKVAPHAFDEALQPLDHCT